jgi:hypothetical protein|tara:strand:+ start:2127 stop:2258 length:132 start_codon:yes stop_codon:yes gene_type:complete
MSIKENYFSGNQEPKRIKKIYILWTCFSTLPKLKYKKTFKEEY